MSIDYCVLVYPSECHMLTNLKNVLLIGAAAALLAGCSAAPKSPMEIRLNRAAGARIAAQQCPAYGGYSSSKAMLKDAEANVTAAKKLGATKEDYDKAKANMNGALMTTAFLIGKPQACNTFINNLALAGTNSPTNTNEF